MKGKLNSKEIIDQVAGRAGITKKLASELMRAIPEIVEEGLTRNGEARIKDFGTFRLKTVATKTGRNPRTGESVVIPAHRKLVFLPEESFRDQVNEEYRFLGIKVLEQEVQQPEVDGRKDETWNLKPGTLEPGTPEPGTPEPGTVSKRRNYWIIPSAIGLIALLSVVFYFRNCNTGMQEDSRQEAGTVESPQPTVVSQQPESLKPGTLEPGTLEPETLEPETLKHETLEPETLEPGTLEPETVDSPIPETRNQKPETVNSETLTISEGKHLFQLSREVYDGNPFLWVLIYRANQDKIKDPDLAVTGENIAIPSLEGTPGKLSRNDSIAVSDGYRLVYEYYLSKGDARAEEFKVVMEKYRPE